MKALSVAFVFICFAAFALGGEPFVLKIDRAKTVRLKKEPKGKNKLVIGTLFLDGKEIGTTYENGDTLVPLGVYKGVVKYFSPGGNAFVQGPQGILAAEGDFLLEVAGVPFGRTGILLHGGDKPKHSTGCILLGPVRKLPGKKKRGYIEPDHPLRILRKEFYGDENPVSSPDKMISIEVSNSSMIAAKRNASWMRKVAKARKEGKKEGREDALINGGGVFNQRIDMNESAPIPLPSESAPPRSGPPPTRPNPSLSRPIPVKPVP